MKDRGFGGAVNFISNKQQIKLKEGRQEEGWRKLIERIKQTEVGLMNEN